MCFLFPFLFDKGGKLFMKNTYLVKKGEIFHNLSIPISIAVISSQLPPLKKCQIRNKSLVLLQLSCREGFRDSRIQPKEKFIRVLVSSAFGITLFSGEDLYFLT